jgi:hypothetical protein
MGTPRESIAQLSTAIRIAGTSAISAALRFDSAARLVGEAARRSHGKYSEEAARLAVTLPYPAWVCERSIRDFGGDVAAAEQWLLAQAAAGKLDYL